MPALQKLRNLKITANIAQAFAFFWQMKAKGNLKKFSKAFFFLTVLLQFFKQVNFYICAATAVKLGTRKWPGKLSENTKKTEFLYSCTHMSLTIGPV